MVTGSAAKVAVVAMLVDAVTVVAAALVSESVASCLLSTVVEVATLVLVVSTSSAPPSSTGQRLHIDRDASQNTSAWSLRYPLTSRLEIHFAAAVSSYDPLPKHAG